MADLLLQLLSLPQDDARLLRLASAAVLLQQECSAKVQWSNAEMDAQRAMILQVQSTTMGSESSSAATCWHFVCSQMLDATQQRLPIPGRNELVLRAAELLFCQPFSEMTQVETALAQELASI
eukprot:TRINITY_DN24482_c0_g1_i1.p1 TRINITY_DN24482_c0_g1~~TRINITY_DN24482_c0_g1_i1.p1  ORF type:complete len:134 (-),score=26.18 TRINITY_DN24482_c0_g1_i1:208-576(-)